MPAALDFESFRANHAVFIRKSRDASHQVLHFLGMLEETNSPRVNEAVRSHAEFALKRIQALVHGVYMQAEYATVLDRQDLDPDDRRIAEQAVFLVNYWRQQVHPGVDSALGNFDFHKVRELRSRFDGYLQQSAPRPWWPRIQYHHLPNTLRYFRKNAAFLLTVTLIFVVGNFVEIVSNLIRNLSRVEIAAAAGCVGLIPGAVLWYIRSLRTRFLVPWWDIGGRAFRSYRYQAIGPERGMLRWSRKSRVTRWLTAGRTIKTALYMLLPILYLFAAPRLVAHHTTGAIWFLFALAVFSLVLARAVDYWDYVDRAPVRLYVLVAAALFIFLGVIFKSTPLLSVLLSATFKNIPLLSLLDGYWILFVLLAVAFAGYLVGFIRNPQRTVRLGVAVVLAFLALSVLSKGFLSSRDTWAGGSDSVVPLGEGDWPYSNGGGDPPVVLIAASGGGSRAAIFTALTLQQLRRDCLEIARQVQAISSVSGGSLANAAYVARLYNGKDTSITAGAAKADSEECSLLTPSDPSTDYVLPPPSPFVGSMQADFILPTLRAALKPWETRGKAIERTWERDPVGLDTTITIGELAKKWKQVREDRDRFPPFPMPLFNATTLDGHGVVISPLPRSLFGNSDYPPNTAYFPEYKGHKTDIVTWVYHRDAIYGLEDLVPGFDPRLSQAVRASANFPFGFPVVKIRTTEPLLFSPYRAEREPGEKTIQLTDGGVLSNSGMWSMFHLMMNKSKVLKERGVLLIVIEASKMPTRGSINEEVSSLFGAISDKGAIGQNLHRRMFDQLHQEYGDRLEIVQIDLLALPSHNVLTTWALNRHSQESLETSFRLRWPKERAEIGTRWQLLRDRVRDGDPQPSAPVSRPKYQRPPVS